MAYDDSPYRHYDGPDLRSTAAHQPVTYEQSGYGNLSYHDPVPTAAAAGESVPAAELADAFDDPVDGEPGRDRLAVHWLWEIVLLGAVVGLGYLLWQSQPDALRGENMAGLLVMATGLGLLAMAAGVTLRAGAPNLAIGPVAAAAGAYFAQRGGEGVAVPTVFVLGVAIMLGLGLALVVVVLHVPGWAASLAAGAAAVVWLQLQPAQIPLTGEYDPTGQAAFLFTSMAAVAILGGLLGTVKPVRRAVGRFRPTGDPAARRGGMAGLLTGGALVLSMVCAVIAGVVLVAGAGVPAQGSVGVNWLTWTVVGLGVALIGGTSAYGRRGGVFGTVLAVTALVLFHQYQQEQGWQIALLATAAVTVVLGLAVTRLVERFGRPRAGRDERVDWHSPASMGAAPLTGAADERSLSTVAGARSSSADSWSSALPARPVPGHSTPWDDDPPWRGR